jgi:hypothetical protein
MRSIDICPYEVGTVGVMWLARAKVGALSNRKLCGV